MRKKIIYIIKSFILGLILSLSSIDTCYADVDIDALQGYLDEVSIDQVTQFNNPKYANQNNVEETIDPITGSLIIKQTDLNLSGKDGLDLNIGRIYNSSQGECNKKVTVTYTTENTLQSINGYGVDVYGYDYEIGFYFLTTAKFDNYSKAYAFYLENAPFTQAPYSIVYNEYRTVTIIHASNYTDKYEYNKIRYNLGAGWSFAFPSVQIEDIPGSQNIYYHDGTGAVYKVNALVSNDNGTSNLEGYQGKDVRFLLDNGSYVNGDNVPSKYKFISSDLTTTYFGADGRILGIKDRFNNEIKFWHIRNYNTSNFMLISKIQDSVGRIITFSYVGNDINISVTAPNESNALNITYQRSLMTKNIYKDGSIIETYKYPILDSVIDPLGRTTYYENYYYYNNNTWPNERFRFESKSLIDACSDEKYLLGAIVYPGCKTIYNYEKVTRNLGESGATEAYRIKSRYDQVQRYNVTNQTMDWISPLNEIDYTYGNDYTGYPWIKADDSQYWSQRTSGDGVSTKTIFNGKNQVLQTESIASDNEKIITKNLEFDGDFTCLPTKTETLAYAADGTLARDLFTGNTYNLWGGVSTVTQPLTSQQFNDPNIKALYTTTYSYDDVKYMYFPTKKQWYQNSTKLLNEIYNYDTLGRVSGYTNAKGETTAYSYYNDSNNNKIVESTLNLESGKSAKTKLVYGSETNYAYPKEELKYYTNDSGVYTETKTTKTYNLLLGLVNTETDNENKTTTYTYDIAGRITLMQMPSFTNEKGETYSVSQEYQYTEGYNWDYTEGNYSGIYGTTENANMCYVNNGTGEASYYNQTSSLYDAYGNLRLESLWNGTNYVVKSKYTYDNMQRVISSVDAMGNTVSQTYNPWGQANEVTDPSGNLYVNDYDIKSNKTVSFFVASENIPRYRADTAANTYKEDYVEVYMDQFGQAVSRKVYENWPELIGELSELYSYDIAGNLTGYIDPNHSLNEDGFTVTYKYDELNRVLDVKDALNQITSVSYTTLGNIASISMKQTASSPDSVIVYTKIYNELGAIESKTDPSAQATQYSYNTIGLNVADTDRNGSSTSLVYDGLNQLAELNQISADGVESLGYKYSYSKPYGYDEVQQLSDGLLEDTESYTYNAEGQITQKIVSGNGYINSDLSMQYDNSGRLLAVGAGARGSDYFYTGYKYTSDRLTQIQTNGQQSISTADTDNASYEYYPDGKLKKITYPKLNDGTFLTTEYTYNALGRLTSLVNKKDSNTLSQFTYTYDANGNIISVNDGTDTKSYVYDKLNRLKSIISQTGNATEYTYDLRGNRLTENCNNLTLNFVNTSYAYRLDNQLESVIKGDETTSMSYYADGMRSKKTTSAGTTHYIYDLSGRLITEGQSTSDISANYVWGPDRVLSKKDSGGEYYYIYNGHGDVVQMVDRNGNVVNNYQYDEWGNILTSNETVSNPFKYAGEIYDQETGLYYLRARYYDPSIGRFINEDSYEGQIDNPLTQNVYTYCANNPLIYTDPSGNVYVMLDYINEKNGGTISYDATAYTFLGIVYKREITITVGGITGTYSYQYENGNILIDSDILVEDFGFDREDAEHQVGDVFDTMDDTALAWSLKYYSLSNDENNPREYASAIYKNGSGYSFGDPNIGYATMVEPPKAPTGYEMVAAIHSHPDLGSSTYDFSKRKYGKLIGDYRWVNNTGLPLYLATGNNLILVAELNKKNKIKKRVVYNEIKF